MIRAFIFDCWNTVFYGDSPFHRFINTLGIEENLEFKERFERCFFTRKINSIEEIIREFLEKEGIPYNTALLHKLAESFIIKDIHIFKDAELGIKERRKRGYKTAVLSNTSCQSYESLKERFKLKQLFDVIILSCNVGFLKPEKRIFEIALEELGCSANEAVMVGDSLEEDIRGAESVGMKAILIDRENKRPDVKNRVQSITELTGIIANL